MIDRATRKEVLALARKRIVRPKALVDQGLLQETQLGLYAAKDFPFEAHVSLAEVAARSPKAVMCLLTVLRFHELTMKTPSVVYVTLPVGTQHPRITNPVLDVLWAAPIADASGIGEYVICGVSVRITSPAKSVVDCFKYRRKVGVNVAFEALHDTWHKRLVTTDELCKLASNTQMTNVMKPYMDGTIA